MNRLVAGVVKLGVGSVLLIIGLTVMEDAQAREPRNYLRDEVVLKQRGPTMLPPPITIGSYPNYGTDRPNSILENSGRRVGRNAVNTTTNEISYTITDAIRREFRRFRR